MAIQKLTPPFVPRALTVSGAAVVGIRDSSVVSISARGSARVVLESRAYGTIGNLLAVAFDDAAIDLRACRIKRVTVHAQGKASVCGGVATERLEVTASEASKVACQAATKASVRERLLGAATSNVADEPSSKRAKRS